MTLELVRSLASYAMTYDTVLFPFDVARLLSLLPKVGYVLAEQVQTMPPSAGTLNVEGGIARRLDTVLQINSDRRTVGVTSTSVAQSLEGLTQIETLLRDELGVDSREISAFYEFMADVHVEASKSPLEAWQRHLAGTSIVTELSSVLGAEASAYGLRVVPSGSIPNQRDWFDIRIEPQVLSPHKLHHINVVFRDQQPDKVEAFIREFDEMVGRLVALVEG